MVVRVQSLFVPFAVGMYQQPMGSSAMEVAEGAIVRRVFAHKCTWSGGYST